MADVERTVREAAGKLLDPWFSVEEEVPVSLRTGQRGFVDLIAIPRDDRFSDYVFAIEIKIRKRMVENGLAAWIKQASDYNQAALNNGGRLISHSFLWMVNMIEPEGDDAVRLRAMQDLAHQFRVGFVRSRARGGFVIQMGPDELFRSSGWNRPEAPLDPWSGRTLERLTSRRQSAGTRRDQEQDRHARGGSQDAGRVRAGSGRERGASNPERVGSSEW